MKNKKNKEPSLFRQLITIHFEQAKRRKALRQLAKMEWSMEFLSAVVVHAAGVMNKDVEIVLETKGGHKMYISSAKSKGNVIQADDDIFNKLDDEAAVQKFIREHTRR